MRVTVYRAPPGCSPRRKSAARPESLRDALRTYVEVGRKAAAPNTAGRMSWAIRGQDKYNEHQTFATTATSKSTSRRSWPERVVARHAQHCSHSYSLRTGCCRPRRPGSPPRKSCRHRRMQDAFFAGGVNPKVQREIRCNALVSAQSALAEAEPQPPRTERMVGPENVVRGIAALSASRCCITSAFWLWDKLSYGRNLFKFSVDKF